MLEPWTNPVTRRPAAVSNDRLRSLVRQHLPVEVSGGSVQQMKPCLLLLAALLWLPTELVASGETPGDLNMGFALTPAATGEQVVRRSLPLPRGFLHTNQALILRAGQVIEPVGMRVLSWYAATSAEPRNARRALVTFCHRSANSQPMAFTLEATNARAFLLEADGLIRLKLLHSARIDRWFYWQHKGKGLL